MAQKLHIGLSKSLDSCYLATQHLWSKICFGPTGCNMITFQKWKQRTGFPFLEFFVGFMQILSRSMQVIIIRCAITSWSKLYLSAMQLFLFLYNTQGPAKDLWTYRHLPFKTEKTNQCDKAFQGLTFRATTVKRRRIIPSVVKSP